MKPVLDITSPVIQRCAALALFEQIQELFNLRPTKMAQAFRSLAVEKNVSPLQLIHPTKETVDQLLEVCLCHLEQIINGDELLGPRSYDRRTTDLIIHFNLSAHFLGSSIKKSVEREEMPANAQIRIVHWLQHNAPLVFAWAFTETERILRQDEEREDE